MKSNKNMQSMRKKKQGGFVLPSYLIVAVLIALGLGGVYAAYANYMVTKKGSDTIELLNKAFDNLPTIKESFGTYSDLNNTLVYNSNKIVVEDVKSPTADTFTTPFSTDGLTFASADSATLINGRVLAATDQFARIDVHDVTDDLCLDIVTGMFERALEIRVGTTRVDGAAAATTQCAAVGTTTDLVFISN